MTAEHPPTPERKDTYPTPEHGWTCFHCGETFMHPNPARQHFGATPESEPACRVLNTEHGFVRRLRGLEMQIDEMRRQRDEANSEAEKLGAQLSAWTTLFPDCHTARDLFNKYDSMEGRALAAEERLTAMLHGGDCK